MAADASNIDAAHFFNLFVSLGCLVLLCKSRQHGGDPNSTATEHEQWLSGLRSRSGRREALGAHERAQARRYYISSIPYDHKFGQGADANVSMTKFLQHYMLAVTQCESCYVDESGRSVATEATQSRSYMFAQQPGLDCDDPSRQADCGGWPWFLHAAFACNSEHGVCKHINTTDRSTSISNPTNCHRCCRYWRPHAHAHKCVECAAAWEKRWWLVPPSRAWTSCEPPLEWYRNSYKKIMQEPPAGQRCSLSVCKRPGT